LPPSSPTRRHKAASGACPFDCIRVERRRALSVDGIWTPIPTEIRQSRDDASDVELRYRNACDRHHIKDMEINVFYCVSSIPRDIGAAGEDNTIPAGKFRDPGGMCAIVVMATVWKSTAFIARHRS
jgi:hypothetical protein